MCIWGKAFTLIMRIMRVEEGEASEEKVSEIVSE